VATFLDHHVGYMSLFPMDDAEHLTRNEKGATAQQYWRKMLRIYA